METKTEVKRILMIKNILKTHITLSRDNYNEKKWN